MFCAFLGSMRQLSLCAVALATFIIPCFILAPVRADDLRGHGGPVMAIALSEDGGSALTGSFDYSMIHWQLSDDGPEIVHRFDEHDAAVNDVVFIPDTSLAATASDDGFVRIWDLESATLVHVLEGHSHKVVDLAVSADGALLASAAWDQTARLWHVETGTLAGVLEGHANNVNAVAFSTDGEQVFTASYDGTVRAWETQDARYLSTLLSFGWGINELQLLPDGEHLLFGSLEGTVGVIDIEAGELETTLVSHDGPVLSLLVDHDEGIAASGGGDGRIYVWNVDDWSSLGLHENPYGPVWAMALSGDHSSFYYGSLDDFAIHWQMTPAAPYEEVRSDFPRRFQVSEDMSLGETQFARKCSVCHTLTPDGANRAGPTLYRVFGRRAGTLPGYAYSTALLQAEIIWNEDTIEQLFDDGPQEFVPGTKMPLQRMTNPEERTALIAFLREATQGDSSVDGDGDELEQ